MENKIAEIRKKKGLTQTELAYRANVAVDHLCRVEKGRKLGSLVLYKKIAKVLNQTVGDLIE